MIPGETLQVNVGDSGGGGEGGAFRGGGGGGASDVRDGNFALTDRIT